METKITGFETNIGTERVLDLYYKGSSSYQFNILLTQLFGGFIYHNTFSSSQNFFFWLDRAALFN